MITTESYLDKFQRRFTLPIIALLAFMLASLSWATIRQLSNTLGDELHQKGIAAVRILSKASSVGLLLGDKESLARLIRQTKGSNYDCEAVALFNPHGELIVTTDPPVETSLLKKLGYPYKSLKEVATKDSLYLRNPVFDRTGQFLGMALLELSRERVGMLVRKASYQLLTTTLGVFVVVAFLLHTLLNKIRQLADIEYRRAADLEEAYQNLQNLQAQLVRSEKMAAIGQLASGVGHELRNPLGAINNALYYIRDALKGSPLLQEDPTLGEFLEITDQEIKSATRIITDLLDFSRVVKLAVQPTDLNARLTYLKSTLDIPPSVKVLEDYASDLPHPMMDAEKMHQVFVNLASNAIQAMPQGGELRIRTRLEKDPTNSHSWVHIDFADTGEGISPDVKSKIFEPLFTTKAKGTGLGLPISLGIVQAHGGQIAVESEPGKGSTFTIRFPLEGGPHDG